MRLGGGDLLLGVPRSAHSSDETVSLAELRAWLDRLENHRQLAIELPLGLDAARNDTAGVDRNPLTRAKIELGRQLFFDPRLSSDGAVSCATCHRPEHGYAAPTRVGEGVDGLLGTRNAPAALNRLLSEAQFHDGRAASLEEQALGPMMNAVEMGSTHELVLDALRRSRGYRLAFERVFADGVTVENAALAIASFERTLVTGPSPWDHNARLTAFEEAFAAELEDPAALADDDPELLAEHESLAAAAQQNPLSESAARGAALFFGERGGCSRCHVGANLTDEQFHNLGVGLERHVSDPQSVDWGRYAVTGAEADRGAFKTPTLRNVAQTAPYLHDGSAATLEAVIGLYMQGGHDNPWLDAKIEPLDLDTAEQADLVAFLRSLTGALPPVETRRLPE
ncbi:cytochrome-c peroxidase [Pseudobythopirellula maris]|uniref:cytochrome-c peroxidase n=1 Tax=Pseudobythopirellula maris TaxID=2527991 RepID=UPI0028F3F8EE|nr:cytochrome c peroxidase [Pseudobythopirellula maris]